LGGKKNRWGGACGIFTLKNVGYFGGTGGVLSGEVKSVKNIKKKNIAGGGGGKKQQGSILRRGC